MEELDALREEKFKSLAKEIHENAVSKGFWDSKPSKEQSLMLIITEISEVVEADRKGIRFDEDRKSGYQFSMDIGKREKAYETFIKGTVEEELADVAIRLLDYMEGFKIGINYKAFESNKGFSSFENLCTMMFFLTKNLAIFFESNFDVGYSIILGHIFAISNTLDIDILWHIKQKMEYNKTRPRLHDKKY